MAVVNPRHVFFQGKWFVYYKGDRGKAGVHRGTASRLPMRVIGPYKKDVGRIEWKFGSDSAP